MSCSGKALFVLGTLMLSLCVAAAQSTEQVLYSFAGSGDGSQPAAGLVFDSSGNLYGTTEFGGAYGYGCVFELMPAQGGGLTESVLYSFTGGNDGAYPVSPVISDAVGNLYGTTQYGGMYGGNGTAFELMKSAGWAVNTLWSFGSGDGGLPEGGLAFDQTGNLYGTLDTGGTHNAGAVFKLTPKAGRWTRKIIHNFGGKSGARPWAGVTLDAAGNVYGTALYDGPGEVGAGIVFKLAPVGKAWKFSIIYNLKKGGAGGGGPFGGVIFDPTGNLYGTTYGEASCPATVFKLLPSVKGPWTPSVLFTFDGADGCQTYGPVAMDNAGNLYGVTASGGNNNSNAGTVFELTKANGYALNTLYNFQGSPDGSFPEFMGVVLDTGGNIYGTTYTGGAFGLGTIFEVSP
jgi:uncharacterized repeat protein (TIGR03803 family)